MNLKKCKIILIKDYYKPENGDLIYHKFHNKFGIYRNKTKHDEYNVGDNAYFTSKEYLTKHYIYIVSDEQICENDYYLNPVTETVYRANENDIDAIKNFEKNKNDEILVAKKIIATNNKVLNLPLIPENFIQKYCVKNGNLDNIFVEYDDDCLIIKDGQVKIRIIEKKQFYTIDEVKNIIHDLTEDLFTVSSKKVNEINGWIHQNLENNEKR